MRRASVLQQILPTDEVGPETSRDSRHDQRRRAQQLLRPQGPALWSAAYCLVGILLSIFQQFVGINVIFYYSTTLWQSVGFERTTPSSSAPSRRW